MEQEIIGAGRNAGKTAGDRAAETDQGRGILEKEGGAGVVDLEGEGGSTNER